MALSTEPVSFKPLYYAPNEVLHLTLNGSSAVPARNDFIAYKIRIVSPSGFGSPTSSVPLDTFSMQITRDKFVLADWTSLNNPCIAFCSSSADFDTFLSGYPVTITLSVSYADPLEDAFKFPSASVMSIYLGGFDKQLAVSPSVNVLSDSINRDAEAAGSVVWDNGSKMLQFRIPFQILGDEKFSFSISGFEYADDNNDDIVLFAGAVKNMSTTTFRSISFAYPTVYNILPLASSSLSFNSTPSSGDTVNATFSFTLTQQMVTGSYIELMLADFTDDGISFPFYSPAENLLALSTFMSPGSNNLVHPSMGPIVRIQFTSYVSSGISIVIRVAGLKIPLSGVHPGISDNSPPLFISQPYHITTRSLGHSLQCRIE